MSYPLSYFEKKAIKDYESGWRAYENFDGTAVYFKDGVYHNTPISLQKLAWAALRAYQDEQRKKGVPIKWDEIEPGYLDIVTDYQAIIGKMDGSFEVGAFTDAFSKLPHGKFTNFRWRAGYPKGGRHE